MIAAQRARTYLWLFVAMSVSVLVNLLAFQQGTVGIAAKGDSKVLRVGGGAVKPSEADLLAETVRAIQRELKELKLYPGQLDGKQTPLIHAAIMAYEQAQALPLTGEPTQSLLRDLIVGPQAGGATLQAGFGVVAGSAAERLVKEIRLKLVALGYAPGSVEGKVTVDLMRAIRAFERDNGMSETGRISAALVLQLQRSAASFKTRAG